MRQVFTGARVFDGERLARRAVVVEGGQVAALLAEGADAGAARRIDLGGGTLAPGFVDLQVNGGGGVNFNDAPDAATLRRMAEAHQGLGALSILPTLVTDTPDRTRAAVAAVEAALRDRTAGIVGLHLEGPHLSLARKGAHDPALIRPMTDADLGFLCDAVRRVGRLMVTLAPENATTAQIAALAAAGAVVSLGHTDAGFDACTEAARAGARQATHLFNAMGGLGNREPGLVGAVLDGGGLDCGLIADGIHVHPATIAAAMRAKRGPGQIYLVTDCMAPAGSDIAEFRLNGRRVLRRQGRLTLEDGTLAGADLDMARALAVMTRQAGVALDQALAMATAIPARVIGAPAGRLRPGAAADMVHLRDDLTVQAVWRAGQPCALSPATRG